MSIEVNEVLGLNRCKVKYNRLYTTNLRYNYECLFRSTFVDPELIDSDYVILLMMSSKLNIIVHHIKIFEKLIEVKKFKISQIKKDGPIIYNNPNPIAIGSPIKNVIPIGVS